MNPPTTLAEALARAGVALYGDDWQSPLARRLNMNLRTMQRIAAAARDGADYPIAPGVVADLEMTLVANGAELLEAAEGLRLFLADP